MCNYVRCDNLPFYNFLGANELASFENFRRWVAITMASVTDPGERFHVTVTPVGYPMPMVDLPGCVHLTTSIKLAQIKILVSFSSVYFYGLHSENDVPEITLKANNQA